MPHWDFRYVESRRYSSRHGFNPTQLRSAVQADDRYWRRRARLARGIWVCLVIIALCLWELWRVFG